ncbi:MAG: hypothetical protein AAFR17_05930 [Pseudomonadota bacterium]
MADVMTLALEQRARIVKELAELDAFLAMAEDLTAAKAVDAPVEDPKVEDDTPGGDAVAEDVEDAIQLRPAEATATAEQDSPTAEQTPCDARADKAPIATRPAWSPAPEMDVAAAWKTYMTRGQPAAASQRLALSGDAILFKTG